MLSRYLNARQMILRPALESYFRKQQSPRRFLTTESREAGLQDLMSSKMAIECVASAVNLIEVLSGQPEQHDFTAWWINVTCMSIRTFERPNINHLDRFAHLR